MNTIVIEIGSGLRAICDKPGINAGKRSAAGIAVCAGKVPKRRGLNG